jgi:hypothetical protein
MNANFPYRLNLGGQGGGGNAAADWNGPVIQAESGDPNTGGGGGGGCHASTTLGGSGGSGIVVLRTLETAIEITGSPTVTTDGSYNIYTFTSSGSISF